MLTIQNVAAADIPQANHFECGDNAMLIQIADPTIPEDDVHPATTPWFPIPAREFKEIHQFQFLDIGDDHELAGEYGCTDEQAQLLVNLLKHAHTNDMNVVVNCMAGICRSGAVCEVGVMMGFNDTGRYRIPNARVKRLMMKSLGWTYDSTDEIYNQITTRLNDE